MYRRSLVAPWGDSARGEYAPDERSADLGALQRAQAVKNWLLERGNVPAERIFLLAGREGDDGKQPKAKISRVDFSLR